MLNSPVLYSWQIGADRTQVQSDWSTSLADGAERFAGRYLRVLQRAGLELTELLRPEIFPASVDRRVIFGSDRPVHLIFKQPADIRLLKGAYNIGVFCWDSPRVSGHVRNKEPFSNQIRMLSLLDEIWVGSSAARSMLQRAGLQRTYVVPCPANDGREASAANVDVDMQFSDRTIRCCSKAGTASRSFDCEVTTFVAEFESRRENDGIDTIVESFRTLPSEQPWRFVLTCRNRDEMSVATTRFLISERIAAAGSDAASRFVLVSTADERQLATVFAAADFFVCGSPLENVSYAMADAILCGCIPITVEHSAMCDLITEESGLVFGTIKKRVHLRPGDPDTTLIEKGTVASCRAALSKALNLDGDARKRLKSRAVAAVQSRFSMNAVEKTLATRFSEITASGCSV